MIGRSACAGTFAGRGVHAALAASRESNDKGRAAEPALQVAVI
jgi:hypothetical protein